MDSVLSHLMIGVVAGAVAGFIVGKIFATLNMGTFWNLVVGAIGGVCMANLIFAYGFDDSNHWFGSLLTALIGGAVGQMFIGKIRHGLKVLWMVLIGKQSELGKDPYRT